ncbi:MAG: hypothetical protein LIO81_09040, partial [Clostridiales bacterium]|nr:hypothetical protein [Clostridiales bacterium]
DSEEDGAMAVDKLIEDDDDTYYVDSNGVMVKNTWVKVVNEDQDDDDDPAEYHYYYMQSSGKAYKQGSSSSTISKKTIDGKRYAFDDDGKMLYGWVTEDGEMANDDTGWADENTIYYFGSWEDGAMKTGWQKITVYDDEDNKDDDYDYWFNFKSNGKKRTNSTKKKLNSKYYAFDSRGVMIYEWYDTGEATSPSNTTSAANWNYFGSPEEGARYYKGWFKVAPPNEDNTFLEEDDENYTFAYKDSDDESERWYYADDTGLIAGEIKKIKGKYYGFAPEGNWAGRMLTGLCALEMDGSDITGIWNGSDGINMDSDDLDDFFDWIEGVDNGTGNGVDPANVYLYYFGDDDDKDSDGAMKTGSTTIKLDGDSYQFYFKKSGGTESRGRGLHGIDDGDYIYRYGLKVKADSDEKYILVYADGSTGDDDVTVYPFDSTDIRQYATSDTQTSGDDYADNLLKGIGYGTYKNEDGDTVRVIYGFDNLVSERTGTAGDVSVFLVNTSGKIQTSKLSAKKDGDDWYWYAVKKDSGRGTMMYASEKELDPYNSKEQTDLSNMWDYTSVSSNIGNYVDVEVNPAGTTAESEDGSSGESGETE